MSYPETVPVVIVGSGPTGLTAGLLLAEYGVRSVILEKNAAPLDIPRAIDLPPLSIFCMPSRPPAKLDQSFNLSERIPKYDGAFSDKCSPCVFL